MKIIKDGSAYLVAKDNFVNLQESKDYFFIEEKELETFLFSMRKTIFKEIKHRLDRKVGTAKIKNVAPAQGEVLVYNKEHVDDIFSDDKTIFWEHDEKYLDWYFESE